MKIDFQALYRAFITPRLGQAEGLEEEEMETLGDRWYEEFNHTPNAQLAGLAPCEYYAQFEGPSLLELAWEYWNDGEELPGQLAHQIIHQGQDTAQALFRLLERALPEVRGEMIELLCQMQYPPLLDAGFAKLLQAEGQEEEETQLWAEAVLLFGEQAARRALGYLPEQRDENVRRVLADIVSQYPVEGAADQLIGLFERPETDLAFYASCLGKLGDESAVETLTAKLHDPRLDYFTYCAIRDAAEELGALVEIDREFAGDKDYETIKAAMAEMEEE